METHPEKAAARLGPLTAHVESFLNGLPAAGYAPPAVASRRWIIGAFIRWTELQAYALVSAVVNERLGEQALVYGDFASGPRTEEKGGPRRCDGFRRVNYSCSTTPPSSTGIAPTSPTRGRRRRAHRATA